jgi:hypothetical protein
LYTDFTSEYVANYGNGSQNFTIIVLSLVFVSCAEKPSNDYVYKRLIALGELSDGFSYDEYILKVAVTGLDIKEGDPTLGK